MRPTLLRFALVYVGVYAVATPTLTYLVPLPGGLPVHPRAMTRLVTWAATHLLSLGPIVTDPGSIDRVFDWVQVLCMLAMAGVAAVVWWAADRRSTYDERLHEWLRLEIRFVLGAVLLYYGMIKVFPVQFSVPLTRLLQPFGAMLPTTLLMSSVAASPAYQMVVGWTEVIAAILLFVPWTWRLGAVLALGEVAYVLLLNLTYDISDKLFAMHLVVMALILAAPDVWRLVNMLARNRAVAKTKTTTMCERPRTNRAATAAQLVLAAYIVGVTGYNAAAEWKGRDRPGNTSSPLYGVWNVEAMVLDGQPRPLLITDPSGWRRVVFEAGGAYVQRMDETFEPHIAAIDLAAGSLTSTRESDPGWRAVFSFQRPAREQLILDGRMDGHAMRLQLRLFDRGDLPLVASRFHWIQERRAPQ